MSGNGEVSTVPAAVICPWCGDLGEDAHTESVEELPGLLDVGTVLRIHVNYRDGAAGSGHDRRAGSPPVQLVLVLSDAVRLSRSPVG